MHAERAGAFNQQEGESTAVVCARVAAARAAAAERWRPYGIRTNAEVRGPLLRKKFRLPPKVMQPLSSALDRRQISMRGADRCLRVAWTLSDLAGRTSPGLGDVTTALSFRQNGGAR